MVSNHEQANNFLPDKQRGGGHNLIPNQTDRPDCSGFNAKGEPCGRRADYELASDGKYYCCYHGPDNQDRAFRCVYCGRATARGFRYCIRHGGPVKKRRIFGNRGVKYNIRIHMDKGLVREEVDKMRQSGKDPVAVAYDAMLHGAAALKLAVRDFEDIRAGRIPDPKDPETTLKLNRDDIIFLSNLADQTAKTAQRTLKAMSEAALTSKELGEAERRILTAMRDVINRFVPKDLRADAKDYLKSRIKKKLAE